MKVLGIVLAPWHAMIESIDPRLKTWAYADDRSMAAKVEGDDQDPNEEAKGLVDQALETTQREFDEPIGLVENKQKRQHLGHALRKMRAPRADRRSLRDI